jgi:hypothetical protein
VSSWPSPRCSKAASRLDGLAQEVARYPRADEVAVGELLRRQQAAPPRLLRVGLPGTEPAADVLEYAQSQSLKALAQAQDAAARQRANQPIPWPSNYQPTPQDTQQDQQRQTALNQANADLAAARTMLDNATSYRDQRGSDTRNKIENAINDGVHDSWWDKFKGFEKPVLEEFTTDRLGTGLRCLRYRRGGSSYSSSASSSCSSASGSTNAGLDGAPAHDLPCRGRAGRR